MSTGAVYTTNLTAGNIHHIVLTANCNLIFAAPPTAGVAYSLTLIIRQDNTGSGTVTWPIKVYWTDGTPSPLATEPRTRTVFSFVTIDGGVSWIGSGGTSVPLPPHEDYIVAAYATPPLHPP